MNKSPSGSEQLSEAEETLKEIVRLNDQLRITGQGGQVIGTQGIASLPSETQAAISHAIQNFTAFTPNNDPYRERDFGSVEVQGITVFWKIDYYDQSMMYLSPDKSDASVTNRVMTIMLASEY